MEALLKNQLQRIAKASAVDPGYGVYTDGASAKQLENQGLIILNRTIEVAEGKVAQRITDAGLAALSAVDTPPATDTVPVQATSTPAPNAQPEGTPPMSNFALTDNVPMPARTMNKPDKYPFTTMNLGQSFFVPHTITTDAETGAVSSKRAISASTVSSANTRYKADGRRFSNRVVVEGEITGVRVWRVALEDEAEAAAA